MGVNRTIRLLSITGSPRGKLSNTHLAHQAIIRTAREYYPAIEERTVHLANQRMELCTGCGICFRRGDCPIKDDVASIIQAIDEADGILFGSPVHVMQVASLAKVFIDRVVQLTHRPRLQHKYVIVVATCAGIGASDALTYMKTVWQSMGAAVIGELEVQSLVPGRFMNRGLLAQRYAELSKEWVDSILEQREYPMPDSERRRQELFQRMLFLPGLGEALFASDYTFWKGKRNQQEKEP